MTAASFHYAFDFRGDGRQSIVPEYEIKARVLSNHPLSSRDVVLCLSLHDGVPKHGFTVYSVAKNALLAFD